jgi:hypothetical protein
LDEYSANTSRGGSVAINFDVIDVEFARSSPDGIQYVTNIAKQTGDITQESINW